MPSRSDERLAALFDAWAANVHAYALRHCGDEGADDVVSETFLVAWRRLGDIPGDPLPWLLVVARHVIANRRRSDRRRDHLAAVLLRQPHSVADAAEDVALDRGAWLAALRTLSDRDREALLLVAWDGLSPTDAARIAGCRERAFRGRLTRARQRLALALQDHESADHPTLLNQKVGPRHDR